MRKQISRREFLRLSGGLAAGALLAACQPQTVIVRETVEVEKEVTKIVAGTPVVETVVETQVVEKVVEVTSTPAPPTCAGTPKRWAWSWWPAPGRGSQQP